MDMFMEYVWENMPEDVSVTSNNLFSRLTLSRDQFNSARKKLYEGLFIIRNPINKYIKVNTVITDNILSLFILVKKM